MTITMKVWILKTSIKVNFAWLSKSSSENSTKRLNPQTNIVFQEDFDGDGLTNEEDEDDDGDGILDGDEDDDGDGKMILLKLMRIMMVRVSIMRMGVIRATWKDLSSDWKQDKAHQWGYDVGTNKFRNKK